MIRYSMIVNGRVQGVGFRYFVQLTACRLNLTGWCKNLINGAVEIEVQGEQNILISFVSEIKKGNYFSRVDDIDLNEIEILDTEKKFTIKY